MQILKKKIENLTIAEYHQLLKLTSCGKGCKGLYDILYGFVNKLHKGEYHLHIAYYRSQIIGWSMLYRIGRQKKYRFQIFVDNGHRKKGYGYQVIKKALSNMKSSDISRGLMVFYTPDSIGLYERLRKEGWKIIYL